MERKEIEFKEIYLDEIGCYDEYSLAELAKICNEGYEEVIKNNPQFEFTKYTISFNGLYDDSGVEANLHVYRLETLQEAETRIDRERQQAEAKEKAAKELEAKKERIAALLKDAEYKTFLKLQKKFKGI